MNATTGTAVTFESQPLPKTMRWWDAVVLLGLSEPGVLSGRHRLLGRCPGTDLGDDPVGRLGHPRNAAGVRLHRAGGHVPRQGGDLASTPGKAGDSTSPWPARWPCSATGWRGRPSWPSSARSSASSSPTSSSPTAARQPGRGRCPDSAGTSPPPASSVWAAWWPPGASTSAASGRRCASAGPRGRSWPFRWRSSQSARSSPATSPTMTSAATTWRATLELYGWPNGTWGKFVLVMAWLYILGYNTYGAGCTATFAPEYKHTKDDTRKAILAVGGINVVCALLLPVAIVGTVGQDALANDTTGVVYLTDVWHAIVGDTAGKVLIALLCAGLLLMMNAAHHELFPGSPRDGQGGHDAAVVRPSQPQRRPCARHDVRARPQRLAALPVPHRLLHPRRREPGLPPRPRPRPLRLPAPPPRPSPLAPPDPARSVLARRGGLHVPGQPRLHRLRADRAAA